MEIEMPKLNPEKLTSLPEGLHPDGSNLYFNVTSTMQRSWVFRWSSPDGKRPQVQIGAYPAMLLAKARIEASRCRNEVIAGRDPRDLYRDPADLNVTFIKLAMSLIDDWSRGKNKRYKERLLSYFAKVPSLHDIPVATMTTDDVLKAIKPIWYATPKTGEYVLNKIGKVMRVAIAKEHRTKANPAAWRDHLSTILTPAAEVQLELTGSKRKARVSLPYDKLPDFMLSLSYDDRMPARCVEFAILTGGRSQEARLAEWSWVDWDGKVIVFPPRIMKAREEHVVPLSTAALALLKSLPRRGKYIFPSDYNIDSGNAIGDGGSLLRVVRDIAPVDLHGFRKTFRNYTGAETDAAWETMEVALAHKVGTETARAYFNDPILKKRRAVMEAWAQFAMSKRPTGGQGAPTGDNVVTLRPVKAA